VRITRAVLLASWLAAGAGCSKDAEEGTAAAVPAEEYPKEDDSEAIRAEVLATIGAQRANAPDLNARIEGWRLPDPEAWFRETFEVQSADELSRAYPRWMGTYKEAMSKRLEQLAALESPIVEIRRFVHGREPGVPEPMKKGLTTMKRRQPMYLVNFAADAAGHRGVDWVVVMVGGRPRLFFVSSPPRASR
jgi:hypothetical protein